MPAHTPAPTPSRGVYGFVMYLSFQLFFILYLIWAIVPEKFLTQIGVTFLPERHWAVTVPIYLLTVLTVFAFVIYPSLGLCMTPSVDDLRTIKDKYSNETRTENDTCSVADKINGAKVKKKVNRNKCICSDKNKCFKKAFETLQSQNISVIPDLRDLDICEVSKKLYLK